MNNSILLVDDDAELLKALAKVLEKDGYAFEEFPRGIDAETVVHIRHDRPGDPGARLGGEGIVGKVGWHDDQAAESLVITAFGDCDTYQQALRDGAFAYLNKPLDRAELRATIRRALARPPPGPPAPPSPEH